MVRGLRQVMVQDAAHHRALLRRSGARSHATAAIGITQREGLGKVRHLATADLWVQQRLRKREFSIAKVPGAENPADLGTKGLEREAIQRFLRTLGMARLEGRAAAAPSLKARST